MYIRRNVQGFDDMAQKTGDRGWSLKNVLRYYKQMENYQGWFDNGKLDSWKNNYAINCLKATFKR
jgi:hemolysin activation/secretion protein